MATYQGTYDAGFEYSEGDVVRAIANNYFYISIQKNNLGNATNETAWWAIYSYADGIQGPRGPIGPVGGGSIGPRGPIGPQGPIGPKGITGLADGGVTTEISLPWAGEAILGFDVGYLTAVR